ncbi:hypothetical protein Tco_0826053 [Tanacetum coccineum]
MVAAVLFLGIQNAGAVPPVDGQISYEEFEEVMKLGTDWGRASLDSRMPSSQAETSLERFHHCAEIELLTYVDVHVKYKDNEEQEQARNRYSLQSLLTNPQHSCYKSLVMMG